MLRSTLMVSLIAAVGSVISFANQLVLARFFGAGAQMDAYLLAISLPLTISSLLSGVLNYQLVPALQAAEHDRGSADPLIRTLSWVLGGSSAGIAIICAFSATWLIRVLNPDLSVAQVDLVVSLAHWTWPCLPLSVMSAIYTAGLHNRYRFAAATVFASAPIVGSLIMCALLHERLGIGSAVWGQLLGYISYPIILRLALGRFRSGCDWMALRRILAEFPYALAATLVFVLYPFSDAVWGSRIGPSSVSYLGYAQRLLVGISGLAVVGATTVIFPRLARQATEGRGQALLDDLGLSLRTMLVCMVPAAALFCALSVPLIQVIFQRGAFSHGDAVELGVLMRPMLVGMAAMSCMGLIFKALFAKGKVRTAAGLSLIGSGCYFILSGALGLRFGLIGVGVSYATSWWLMLGFGLRCLWRDVPMGRLLISRFDFAVRLSAAAALIAGIGFVGSQFLPGVGSSNQIRIVLVLACTAATAGGAYLALGNGPLALSEVKLLTRQILAFAKRV